MSAGPREQTTEPASDVVARAKAALEDVVAPGPWEMRDGFVYPLSLSARPGGIWPGDAAFIVAARSLVPELVAEVERLRALYVQVRETAERLRYDNRDGVS